MEEDTLLVKNDMENGNASQSASENGNASSQSDEEEKRDKTKDSGDENDDEICLSDEGLGDITSEASNSPQPPSMNKNYVKSSSDVCEDNNKVTQPPPMKTSPTSLPTSPCDERVPSRIAFPKPRKSQTNL